MPDVIAPVTFRATQTFTLGNGDVMQNVLHFFCNTGLDPTLAQVTTFEAFVAQAWEDNIAPHVSTEVTLVKVKIQDLRSLPYPTWEFDENTPGEEAGDTLPYQLAVCCSLRTAHPGRSGRGRIYLGGFTEPANTVDGTVSSTVRAAVQAYAQELIDGGTLAAQPAVLAVRSLVEFESFPVTNTVTDNRWDIQRRRANRRI